MTSWSMSSHFKPTIMTTLTTPSHPAGADARPNVDRIRRPGLDAVIVHRDGLRELHVTVSPLPHERPSILLWRLDSFLREQGGTVVRHEVFGALEARAETLGRMNRLFGGLTWPVTWLEGLSCNAAPVAGMNVFAVAGPVVDTVLLDDRPVGRTYHDGWARHCLIGDLRPDDPGASREEQTARIFQRLEAALAQVGMVLSQVARTWLFLEDILDWYTPFNSVRTEIFTQRNLFARGVPASTGVGARNGIGAALVAGAWAVQPLDKLVQVSEVGSPQQCSARRYGSCFSRAVEMRMPGLVRLLVSGTASIDAHGRSAHSGDVRRQIQLTMEVVEAILSSRRLHWAEVTRAVAYFKSRQDAPVFEAWCAAHRIDLPVVLTQCDICRDELLFEIEVDALARPGAGPNADTER